MHPIRLPVLPVLLALLAACTGPGDTQPDWIDGVSKAYPAQSHLLGRGQSETRAIAQDRARADLAKVFEVRIREQSTDTVAFESKTDAEGQPTGQLATSARREVQTRTQQIIQGIRIGDLWRDPATGQYPERRARLGRCPRVVITQWPPAPYRSRSTPSFSFKVCLYRFTLSLERMR
ncbi:MAG TPA: hypothetical protein EYP40_01195 [Chromatiales bacterium]|nr:hypothetical protein [Chromatiales bacterium]